MSPKSKFWQKITIATAVLKPFCVAPAARLITRNHKTTVLTSPKEMVCSAERILVGKGLRCHCGKEYKRIATKALFATVAGGSN